jgi:hypothetical protein
MHLFLLLELIMKLALVPDALLFLILAVARWRREGRKCDWMGGAFHGAEDRLHVTASLTLGHSLKRLLLGEWEKWRSS